MITEQLLRDCVKEAQEKGQYGLFVWVNMDSWDAMDSELKSNSADYDFAISQILKGEDATIFLQWAGFIFVGIFAVSVEKLSSSDEYFKDFLKVCEINRMKGPIVLIPSNKLSEYC